MYFGLTLLIPSQSVIAALGTIGAPSTLVAIASLVWWVWYHVHRGRVEIHGAQLVRRAAIFLMLALLVVYRHALMQPMVADEVMPADSGLLRFLGVLGIVLTATDGISSPERLQVLIRRMTLGTGAVALLSIFQVLTGQLWVDKFPIPGLVSSGAGELIARGAFLRPSGTSVHPIEFGAVLGMMLPLMISHARTSISRRPLMWSCVALTGMAVVLSLSRTALVCSVIGVAILVPVWSKASRRLTIVGSLLGFAAVSVVVPGLLGTIRGLFVGSDNDPSVQSRTAGYSYAAQMFSHSPWLGRGYGTFLPRYYIFDNGYLQFTVETGLVGVFALLGLIVVAGLSAYRASRRFALAADRELARAALAAVVAGAVSVGFFDLFAFPQSASCLALVLGISGASYRLSSQTGTKHAVEVQTGDGAQVLDRT
ncbi:MAG: O-antigen ligase family protein [Lapillicoccus sp.]